MAEEPTPKVEESQQSLHLSSLFPPQQVSLLGGPGGSGKTTLIFQILADLVAHKPIYGYNSYSAPFGVCYAATTRPNDATRALLTRLRLPAPAEIPILSVIDDSLPLDSPQDFVDRCLQRAPLTKLLVIDPILAFVLRGTNQNDYGFVSTVLRQLTAAAQHHKISILGIGKYAKTKQGEGYQAPRERFSGSVAWSDCTATMMLLEPKSASNPADPSRSLLIITPNSSPETYELKFTSDGRLQNMADGMGDYVMDEWLRVQASGTELLTETILSVGMSNGLSRRSCFRWCEDQIENNLLVRASRGVYKVCKSC